MKKYIVILLFIVYLFLIPMCLCSVDFSSRLSRNRVLHRLSAQNGLSKVCLVHQTDIRQSNNNNSFSLTGLHETIALTLEHRAIALGRLYPQGVWREIDNPLSYKPDSAVFTENSGYRPRYDISVAGIKGLGVNVMNIGHFFIVENDTKQIKSGGHVKIPIGNRAIYQTGFVYSSVDREVKQNWFEPDNRNKLDIFHIIHRKEIAYNLLEYINGYIDVLYAYSAEVLGFEGWYLRGRKKIAFADINLIWMLGFTSPHYLNTRGSYNSFAFGLSSLFEYFPANILFFDEIYFFGAFDYKKEHLPNIPAQVIPIERHIEGGVSLSMSKVNVSYKGFQNLDMEANGLFKSRWGGIASLLYSFSDKSIEGELLYQNTLDDKKTFRYTIKTVVDIDPHKITILGRFEQGDKPATAGFRIRKDLVFSWGNLYSVMELYNIFSKASYDISIGWTVSE